MDFFTKLTIALLLWSVALGLASFVTWPIFPTDDPATKPLAIKLLKCAAGTLLAATVIFLFS